MTEVILAYFIARNQFTEDDDLVHFRLQLDEILDPNFMLEHTGFESIDEMVQAGLWEVETADDFRAIPEREWSDYVREVSDFSSWKDMLESAANEWLEKHSPKPSPILDLLRRLLM